MEGNADVEGVAAGLTAGKVAEVGVKIGVEEGVVVGGVFSAGRNSVCLMRPPASAVQMLSAMDSYYHLAWSSTCDQELHGHARMRIACEIRQ